MRSAAEPRELLRTRRPSVTVPLRPRPVPGSRRGGRPKNERRGLGRGRGRTGGWGQRGKHGASPRLRPWGGDGGFG